MSTRQTCDDITTITDAEQQHYSSILKPMYTVPAEVRCDLETRHDDVHRALIQASGPNEWWLRWKDSRREVLVVPWNETCADTPMLGSVGPGDAMVCRLPAEHPGRHSFDLEDTRTLELSPYVNERLWGRTRDDQ